MEASRSTVASGVPGERNEPSFEALVPGPLDFGLPPRMRSEVVGISSALSCLLKSRLVTPSKREVAGWSLVSFTPSGRVDGSRVSLESSEGLGIGGWVSATPSSRVVGSGKVSFRCTPSSVGKGSWGGGGRVEKIFSPAGGRGRGRGRGRATVGGWTMARVVGRRSIEAMLGQQHERCRHSGRSPKVLRLSRRMRRRDRKGAGSQG
jgi:hypothetical protein